VPTPQGDPQEQSQWHLFNDFLVTPVPQEEALSFSAPYKTPVILTYQLQQYKHTLDHTWKDRLDPSCLFLNGTMNLLPNPEGMPLNHTTEFPSAGTHIAIDAEFVVLQRALLSIPASASADTIVLRPTRQALGRVSILRGSGADEGVPFIDDYVVVNEPIVDYVTQYSGIKEGDLDPRRSTRAPVSLKVTYKKLWLLLNLGCIFVGHGLYSDFRQINIHAPEAQVIDTSTLFYKENKYQRTLKLSLLARFFLVEDIQTGNHDSVEDARTALRLWRKFQEFEDAGITKQKIKEVYRYGEEFGFDPAVRGKKGHQVRNNLGGSSVDVGRLGVAATGSATPSGRVTPEVGLAAGNGPVTPVAKGRAGEGEAYFESPLR
jgi:PAB-dependent poly(A)-specific ribonuclease subunit 2